MNDDPCTLDQDHPCTALPCACDGEGCDACEYRGGLPCVRCQHAEALMRAEAEDARRTMPRYVVDYATDLRDAGRGHLLREDER